MKTVCRLFSAVSPSSSAGVQNMLIPLEIFTLQIEYKFKGDNI